MITGDEVSRWLAVLLLSALASGGASAQSVLNGYWAPSFDEDFDERIPGPDQGDYAGLPVTKSAVSVAHTWDPEELTELEIQCRPHPSIYGLRGGPGLLRIWEVRDPYTQQQTELQTWIHFQSAHRHIYLDPNHPHPPPWAPKTWQGFSVGRWVGNVLEVHTDNVRAAWVRRNGLPTDDRATMDERFFRYGGILTHIMMLQDPQYLSEPLIKSNNFTSVDNGAMEPYPCATADEIPRAEGIVPMHLPGYDPTLVEWAVRHRVPLKAAEGGAETMYPEYQDTMKKLPPNPPLSQIEQAEKKIINQRN